MEEELCENQKCGHPRQAHQYRMCQPGGKDEPGCSCTEFKGKSQGGLFGLDD